MIGAILSVFAALMIFLILTENLTINFKHGENYTVFEINFMVFAIVFENSDFYPRRKRKKFNAFNNLLFLKFLLPRSVVKIHSLIISVPERDPQKNAVLYGVYHSLTSSILAFIESYSKFFEASNITILYSEHNNFKKQFEAELKISLLDVLICAISYFSTNVYYRFTAKGYKMK